MKSMTTYVSITLPIVYIISVHICMLGYLYVSLIYRQDHIDRLITQRITLPPASNELLINLQKMNK